MPSLALAVSVGLALEFIFGGLIVASEQGVWVVSRVRDAITTLLSGSLLPLALLPWGIGNAFAWLPFASMASAPLKIYTGTGNPLWLLPVQAGWSAVLWPLALWLWRANREKLVAYGRDFFRKELTDLEQFVMIQIFDQSWKDHLYAMDMLRNGIGLQAFAEKDPRIQYKKEGYKYFGEMMEGIRDKVTDLIFRARIVGNVQARNAYQVTAATHEETGGYGVGENSKELAAATATAGGGEASGGGDGEAGAKVVKPIVRESPKVGRNDPCPCGSGRKYKKCHGATAA